MKPRTLRTASAIVIAITVLLASLVLHLRALTWDDVSPGPWQGLRVALPEGSGTMTFRRQSIHPWQAEYDRKVTVDPADGRSFTRPLATNYGGRTLVFVFWRSADGRAGPSLLLRERRQDAHVDVRRGRVTERRRQGAFSAPPGWRYIGRIDGTDGRFHFVDGKHWTGETDRDR